MPNLVLVLTKPKSAKPPWTSLYARGAQFDVRSHRLAQRVGIRQAGGASHHI